MEAALYAKEIEMDQLAVLQSYRVLGTSNEEPFDRITRLAVNLVEAPIQNFGRTRRQNCLMVLVPSTSRRAA
jgi:hypothetical protein